MGQEQTLDGLVDWATTTMDAMEAAWADWTKNVALRPIGTHVEYTEDDGTKTLTTTASLPFHLGDRSPVILLKDKRGGQALERVRVLSSPLTVHVNGELVEGAIVEVTSESILVQLPGGIPADHWGQEVSREAREVRIGDQCREIAREAAARQGIGTSTASVSAEAIPTPGPLADLADLAREFRKLEASRVPTDPGWDDWCHYADVIERAMKATETSAALPQAPRVCVAVLVTDPEGRILLGRRAKPPNLHKWVFPGGGVESGETLREAARREVREETGLDVTIPEQRAHVVENTGTKGTTAGFRGVVILFFRGTATGEPIAGDDLLEPTWFARDALPEDRSTICREMLGVFERDGAAPPASAAELTADDVMLRIRSDPEFLREVHEKLNAAVALAQASQYYGKGGETH